MQNADWISLIVLAEFALIVTLVLAGVLAGILRRRRRDRAAAEGLVAKIRKSEPQRRGALKERFEDAGIGADEAEDLCQRLIANGRHFYDHLLAVYLERDAEGMGRIDERLESVIASYLTLARTGAPAAPAAAATDTGETARLRQMVQMLSQDMSLYRGTLNRVFSEYTAMFGVHLDPKQQLTAREIADRLESGELGGEAVKEASGQAPPE
jgi:hypothetical protein